MKVVTGACICMQWTDGCSLELFSDTISVVLYDIRIYVRICMHVPMMESKFAMHDSIKHALKSIISLYYKQLKEGSTRWTFQSFQLHAS